VKIDVLGLRVDNVTMDEAVKAVVLWTKERRSKTIFTPNAEIVMASIKNTSFRDILNSSDLTIPDGAGVVLGSKLLKTPITEKVAGIDLITTVFKRDNPLSVFLFGGSPGVAEKASKNIHLEFPSVNICGTIHGYHDPSYHETIITEINNASPDLLLVALGPPLQENWIYNNRNRLQTGMLIGCGGALDVFSGNIKRAPAWMIKLNLEWLHRLIKQPKRIGRMMRIPVFLLLCIKKRLFGKA